MRKNFMLSLAAMAALPMAGLANTAWSVGPQTEWAKVDKSAKDPVFYSAESFYGYVGLTYNKISLPKGKYTLVVDSYTNVDFIITVNGTPLNGGKSYENQSFELSGDTNDVTLELRAKNTKEKFTVDGLKFRLEFDFSKWQGKYQTALSEVESDIDNVAAGELKTALEKSYNDFDEAIQKMENDNGQPAFEVYRDYKLYNGENSVIAQAIVRMSNAAKIFYAANSWKNTLTTDFNDCGDYTKSIYEKTVNDKIGELSNILEALPGQYADGKVAVYNEKDYDKYDNLDKNLKAHDEIKQELDKVQQAYDTHCVTLTNNLKKDYEKLLAPAQKALDTEYAVVTKKVGEFLSTVTTDLDDKKKAEFISCFTTQTDAMQKVVDNYYSGETSYYKQMTEKFAEVAAFRSQFETAKGYDDDFKAIFTNSDKDCEYPTGIPGFAAAKSTINTCLSNIQSIFDNAMAKVADNKELVFTHEVKEGEGTVTYVYSNELQKAQEALSNVNITAANTAVSNYKALQAAVEGVQTNLDAAKKTVLGLDTENKYTEYKIWDRNSVIYDGYYDVDNNKNKGLEDRYKDCNAPLIDAKKTIKSINDAYNATCVTKDDKTDKTLIEQLNADIAAFVTNATTAFNNYKTVKDAIVGWNGKSAKIWEIISANTTIPRGEKGSETYGAAMNDADHLIDDYETALNTAVTKNGAEHYEAMSSLKKKVSEEETNYFLTTSIDEIQKTYKSQFDKWSNLLAIEMFNSNAIAAAKYATELVRDRNTAENNTYAVNDDNKKKYGKRLTTDILGTSTNKTGSLADIESKLTTCLQGAVKANLFSDGGNTYTAIELLETAEPEEVTTYIANLDKYYLELVTLDKMLAALHEKAATIAKEYEANCNAYNAVVPFGLKDETLGMVKNGTEVVCAPFATQIATIWDSSKDDSRESVGKDLYDAKSNIYTQIQKFKNDITQSYVTDEDVEDKKEKFQQALTDIQTAINEFKDTVDESNKNLAAYDSQMTTFNNTLMVGETMTIAYKEYLNVKAVVNDGHTFYAGKLSVIDSEIAALKQDIKASYDDYDSVKDNDTHTKAITEKQNAVNAAVTNCQLNDANYTALNKQKDGTTDYYNDILGKIQEKPLNTSWVNSMENIQKSMTATSGNIEKSFAGGALCDTKNVKPYQDAYTNYNDQIGKVWTSWLNGDDTKVGYLQTVLAANNATHGTFTKLVSEVTERYTTVSNNLKKYLDYGVDAAAVATALDALYEQKTSLDEKQQTESEAFYELLAENSKLTSESLAAGNVPEIFVATEHTEAVNTILGKINTIYGYVVAEQNKKAADLLSPVVNTASETVAKYKKDITEAGYYDNKSIVDELKTYFEDVDADLNKAKNTWLESDELALHYADYTQTLQKLIDTEKPESKLSIALANIATAQKDLWKSAIETQYAAVTGEGGKFDTYPDYAEGYKDAYNELYNSVVAQWPETASYAGMKALNELYKSFMNDKSINEFLNLIQNVDKSNTVVAKIEALKTYQNLAAVKTNINSLTKSLSEFAVIYKYAVAYDNMNPLDQAAFKVNEFERTFEEYKTQNCVHSKEEELTDLLTTINSNLWYNRDDFELKVIRSEFAFLNEQLIQLKSAINIYNGSDKSYYITQVQNYTTSLGVDFAEVATNELIALCKKVQEGIAQDLAKLTKFEAADELKNLQDKNKLNNEAFIVVNETYKSLYDFQKKKLQDDNHYAVENTYDQIDKTITANEKWLVLCADNLYKRIEESAKNLDNYKIYADNEVKKVTEHEDNKDRLNKQLKETYKESFDELAELINDFQSEDVQTMFAELTKYYNANVTAQDAWVNKTPKSYDDFKKAADKLEFNPAIEITQQGEAVNAPVRVASSSVDVSNILTKECKSFETFFKNANKELSYKEAKYRIETFSKTFPEGHFVAKEGEFVYPEAGLDAEYDRIDGLYEALKAYCDAAYSSTVTTEIDGTKLYEKDANGDYVLDKDGNKIELPSLKVDFVDCRQAIFDQVKNLEDALSDYNDMIDNNTGMYGDVDHDKVVDVNDFATLKLHLLGEYELDPVMWTAANVNGDEFVNIGDLTRLVGMILGTAQPATPVRVAMPYATSNDALSVVVEGEGVHQRIGIMLDAQQLYAGCQMDILLPEGVTLVGESLGEMAAALSLSSNDLENGCHRIILSSIEGNAMTTGNGAMMWLDVDVDHNYSGEGIALSNVLFANAAGRTFELSVANNETTGLSNVSMTQEVKEKIYNVGGILMDSLKRGVNIIRGNDGTSKKVLK